MADTSKAKNEWDKRELGALWTKESQGSGKKYFSGHIKFETDFGEEKKINVVAFHNRDKKSENSPDFRIYMSKPVGERATGEGKDTPPAVAEAAQDTEPVAAESSEALL
jgi:uncharacterized protein (DUF736 family)|tara:strand:+ start:633 stop:959 length:327 start_codon:yes stop_codon:yes gene_type:complete